MSAFSRRLSHAAAYRHLPPFDTPVKLDIAQSRLTQNATPAQGVCGKIKPNDGGCFGGSNRYCLNSVGNYRQSTPAQELSVRKSSKTLRQRVFWQVLIKKRGGVAARKGRLIFKIGGLAQNASSR